MCSNIIKIFQVGWAGATVRGTASNLSLSTRLCQNLQIPNRNIGSLQNSQNEVNQHKVSVQASLVTLDAGSKFSLLSE